MLTEFVWDVSFLKIRIFVLFTINCQAKSYYKIINLNVKDANKPLAFKGMINEKVEYLPKIT